MTRAAFVREGRFINPAPDAIEVILAAASCGDEAAWRELIARYGRRVFALARSRCRRDDLAEEITQSVFTTIAEKLRGGEYTEQGRFEAWLFRVAMNRVRDEARRVRRRPEAGHDAEEAVALPREGPDADELQALRSAIETLSDSDREVIELRHHACLSFKEISEMVGEPVGTLLARHHRAIRKLKDQIEQQNPRDREGSSR